MAAVVSVIARIAEKLGTVNERATELFTRLYVSDSLEC
jgi:hypothetical protein